MIDTPKKIKVINCGFNEHGAYYTIDSDEISICTVKLIEASPHLLEVLVDILRDNKIIHEQRVAAKKAIAKAMGDLS